VYRSTANYTGGFGVEAVHSSFEELTPNSWFSTLGTNPELAFRMEFPATPGRAHARRGSGPRTSSCSRPVALPLSTLYRRERPSRTPNHHPASPYGQFISIPSRMDRTSASAGATASAAVTATAAGMRVELPPSRTASSISSFRRESRAPPCDPAEEEPGFRRGS
jgi:hypothetical protein